MRLERRSPRLVSIIDPANILQGRVRLGKIDIVGLLEIRKVADGIVDQRIVGLKRGVLINLPEWIEWRVKNVRCEIRSIAWRLNAVQVVFEPGDRFIDILPRYRIDIEAQPFVGIRRNAAIAYVDLVHDAIRCGTD